MLPVKGQCFISPAEDAPLLLGIVLRHLQTMRFYLEPLYPDEDWGFQAQQVLEKLLKAELVLRDQLAPRTYAFLDLALLLDEQLLETPQKPQVFAFQARYRDGPFDLPASREILLAELQGLLAALEERIHDQS